MLKLKPEQKKVLEEIRKSEIFRDFYLAGGTCLLLRCGHEVWLLWFDRGIELPGFFKFVVDNKYLNKSTNIKKGGH